MKMCNNCFSMIENDVKICPKCKSTSFEYLFEKDNTINEQAKQQCNQQYAPKCPTCGSPDVSKISVANKVGHGAVFGLFSLGHISKTYHCKNCGYEW